MGEQYLSGARVSALSVLVIRSRFVEQIKSHQSPQTKTVNDSNSRQMPGIVDEVDWRLTGPKFDCTMGG